jgi:hypothetical protein
MRSCPQCASLDIDRQGTAVYSLIDYYRCQFCGHVWSVNRTTGETIQHVPPLKPKEPRKGK